MPAELTAISGATEYTVSTDDYKSAWGSDEDYISAFAPMTSAANKLPGILKKALPEAAEGSYAIVRYNESETNPTFISNSDIPSFTTGTYFLVADGVNGAGSLSLDKSYGYLPEVEMSVDHSYFSDPIDAFTFESTDGGFYIKDCYGRFLYQSGSYNSFNVAYTLPESGAVWTVAIGSNGLYTITNVTTGKWIQYDGNYSSWGSYDSEKGSLPVLYKAPDPLYFIVAEGGYGAAPLAEDKDYGYLPRVDLTILGGFVTGLDFNAFTFVPAGVGYSMKHSYGRYLYQSGTYNSFNVSAEMPEAGALWSITRNAEGLATITNNETAKWIQYDQGYNSWGSYDSEKGLLPKLYMPHYRLTSKLPAKVVAGTPVTTSINAVYYFNGSEWAVADGVSALNPADYEAMGVDNAKLTDPEIYIPLYLKNKLIYAQNGDQQIVVYNYNKAALFVYDGANWTLNNNGLENVVGRFTKANNAWSFTKYIGKAIFDFFKEDQVIRDRSYLLVHDNVCATALDKSSNYGYINVSSVEISGETIVLPTDAYAYTFASSVTINDVEYKAPEGQFLMRDSNNRYLYMSGTYNSFNIKDNPTVTDGAVDAVYFWTAERQADGTWKIKNVGAGQDRIWGYSISHSSFGAYDTMDDTRVLPTLYIMSE